MGRTWLKKSLELLHIVKARISTFAAKADVGDGVPMIGRCVIILLMLLGWALPLHAAPEYPGMGPDIFDRRTQGEVLIDQAVNRCH